MSFTNYLGVMVGGIGGFFVLLGGVLALTFTPPDIVAGVLQLILGLVLFGIAVLCYRDEFKEIN